MATSGTFTGARGGDSNGPWLSLEWERITEDIPNNRSEIRLTLRVHAEYSLYFSASKTGVLDGTSFTHTSGFSGTGSKVIKTKDVWVNHDSDGGRSEAFSASFNIAVTHSGNYVSSLSVSGTAVITAIPRASDFTAFTLANTVLNTSVATTINYTLARKSTAFTQDMTLKYGSKVIASWNTASTGALTRALSATEVNSILTAITTATSGSLTLTMQTKSGSTLIGSLVSRTAAFTLNAAIVPTATALSVSIYGTGRDKTILKYVQSISKVTASFTRTAGYGASISTSTITVKRQSDSGNSQTIASNSGTTANPVTLSGVYVVTGTVTDSRGRTATVSATITVDAYSVPSISKFTATRATPTTNVSAAITTAWSPLGTSNPTTILIKGVNNVGTVVTLYTLSNSTLGVLNTTQTYTAQSDASSYTYTMTVTDSFGKVATSVSKIGTSFVELTIAKGKGIGIGKVHESGALDVNGDANILGNVNATRLKLTSLSDAGAASTAHALSIGNDLTGDSMKMDANELSSFNAGAVSALHLNPDGGEVTINNSIYNSWVFKSDGIISYPRNKYTNGYNMGSIRDGTSVHDNMMMILNVLVNVDMAGLSQNHLDLSFPATFSETPIWIVAQPVNVNSASYKSAVYSPTTTGCRVYMTQVHNATYTGIIQCQIIACGKRI